MGITERKEREKLEMRDLIINTAVDLFVIKGFDKTSMRNIAEAIEYSPATIYLYFKDKNELLYAISEKAFFLFFQYFKTVLPIKDPMERLNALGRVYINFAISHPAYYDLMFIMRSPMESTHTVDDWPNGKKSHDILTSAVSECMEQGYFKHHDPHALSFMIWSTVHGIVTLYLRNRMKMYHNEERKMLLDKALDSFRMILESS